LVESEYFLFIFSFFSYQALGFSKSFFLLYGLPVDGV